MFCSQCGNANQDGAIFCSTCGARLAGSNHSYDLPSQNPAEYGTAIYAGFWRRVAAQIVDYLLIFVAVFTFAMVLGFAFGLHESGGVSGDSIIDGISFVGGWLYFALMESSVWQATIGKRLIGVKVADVHGRRISFGRATLRYLSKFVSGVTLCIGYLMAAFTRKKQALHDKMVGTIVIKSSVDFSGVAPGNQKSGMSAGAIIGIVVGVLFIPIMAAIALPAYQEYQTKAEVAKMAELIAAASIPVTDYAMERGQWPSSVEDAGFSSSEPLAQLIDINENGVISINGTKSKLRGKTLMYVPNVTRDQTLEWGCVSENIESRYLPRSCHSSM